MVLHSDFQSLKGGTPRPPRPDNSDVSGRVKLNATFAESLRTSGACALFRGVVQRGHGFQAIRGRSLSPTTRSAPSAFVAVAFFSLPSLFDFQSPSDRTRKAREGVGTRGATKERALLVPTPEGAAP